MSICRRNIQQIVNGYRVAIKRILHVEAKVEEARVFVKDTIEIARWCSHAKWLLVLYDVFAGCAQDPPYFVVSCAYPAKTS